MFRLDANDRNLSSLYELFTSMSREPMIVQKFLAFSTETFSAKDCIKVGLPLTIGYALMLIFAQTYWHILGIF